MQRTVGFDIRKCGYQSGHLQAAKQPHAVHVYIPTPTMPSQLPPVAPMAVKAPTPPSSTRKPIHKRDELSFLRTDEYGHLFNWRVPSRSGDWHEHAAIGGRWCEELAELAHNNPCEAYHAMMQASHAMARYIARYGDVGHVTGFMERLARWALAGMQAERGRLPEWSFVLRIEHEPQEGFAHWFNPKRLN